MMKIIDVIFMIFLINDEIIVELNGRFWHGDPRWYKENDILNFPGENVKVSNIWEKR